MDGTLFHERADSFLADALEAIEIADPEQELDVDLMDGILTIEIEDKGEYVINKHEPSVQIWMSSPVTGAQKFAYREDEDEWRNKQGDSFHDVLSDELSELTGLDVEF